MTKLTTEDALHFAQLNHMIATTGWRIGEFQRLAASQPDVASQLLLYANEARRELEMLCWAREQLGKALR